MRESALMDTTRDYLQWLSNLRLLYTDRLNSGAVIVVQGEKRRKVNLCKSGTADWMIILHAPCSGIRLVFWETKATKGKLSADQREFRDKVVRQGAMYVYGDTLDPLVEILRAINPKIPKPGGEA